MSGILDWNWITGKAYETLLEMRHYRFPVAVHAVSRVGIDAASYQEYAELAGFPVELLSRAGRLKDAYCLVGLRGRPLILYNGNRHVPRVAHSIWHEVGHIVLGHTEHGPQEEIEAHFFAAQIAAPNAVLRMIMDNGYSVGESMLRINFGLSQEAALKRIGYLKRFPLTHSNRDDDYMFVHYAKYVNGTYAATSRVQAQHAGAIKEMIDEAHPVDPVSQYAYTSNGLLLFFPDISKDKYAAAINFASKKMRNTEVI